MPLGPLALPVSRAAVLLAAGCLFPAAALPADASPPPPSSAPRPAAAAARAAGTGPSTATAQPIVIDAAYSHVDYKTNTVIFRNVMVSQGDTRVSAERARATGVAFTDSEWTFDGQVVIVLKPRGTLRADRAVVKVRENRITEATMTGKPARFEQQPNASGRAADGHADRIVYDAKGDSIQLSGDASLSVGHNMQISGPVLDYDIRNQQLRAASPSERRRVHITVTPERKKGQAPSGEAPRR